MGIFLLWATWAREYWLFLETLMGIPHGGVIKELDVCDFEKIWSVCQGYRCVCLNATNIVNKKN